LCFCSKLIEALDDVGNGKLTDEKKGL